MHGRRIDDGHSSVPICVVVGNLPIPAALSSPLEQPFLWLRGFHNAVRGLRFAQPCRDASYRDLLGWIEVRHAGLNTNARELACGGVPSPGYEAYRCTESRFIA